VFRACRELGIATVAVAAPDDTGSLHARSADETVEIASYLASEEHVRAAKHVGADAIHPGYGFLAENADFARAVEAAGLVWVGPPPEALEAAGDKLRSKQVALEAGVPVVESGEPADLGFPLILKAAAGGGGRGMRVVRSADELDEARAAASREAEAAFGDGTVFAERYVERPRHVEIQLLADAHGNVVALGERECSVQRRHQKVLEEAPSPALDPALRVQMSDAAVAFARAIGYRSAGTAEFMLDGRDFWFLELNGRIQVEHPVTELVTASTSCRSSCASRRASRSRQVTDCYLATRSRFACTRRTLAPSSRRPAASSGCGCPTESASTPASRRATRSRSRTTR
jgi:acetyl/propionyl-CoA carboxylase alpha subunit